MKIKRLVLQGFKRFDLLGSDTLVYTPQSPYQLVLGKNGIGKSSLLNELSPLPVESSDLKENGFKEIEIEHRGSTYLLKYCLHKKLDCYFIKDGVELNDGNTIKVQRDLIWEHFQYDNNIHQVLTDFTLLTNMTGQVRREWFVRMSSSDMNYAISLYNRLKSAERDIKGAIKLNNQRIVAETAKLPSKEDLERAKAITHQLKAELNHLLPFSDYTLKDYGQQILNLGVEVSETANRIIDLDLLRLETGKNIVELNESKQQLEYDKTRLTQDYRDAVNKLTELQDIYTKNQSIQSRPLEDIDKELGQVEYLLKENNHELEIFGFDVGNSVDKQLVQYAELKAGLSDLFGNMPRNPLVDGVRHYTADNLKEKEARLNSARLHVVQLKNKLSFLEKAIERMQQVHDIQCPSCQHQFKPGVDCNELREMENQYRAIENEIREMESKINGEYRLEYEDQYNYQKHLDYIRRLQDAHILHLPLFKLIASSQYFHNEPRSLIPLLNQYQRALEIRLEIDRLTSQHNLLSEERIRRVAADGLDNEYILKTMHELEARIESIKRHGHEIRQQCDKITQQILLHQDVNQLSDKLRQQIEEYRRLSDKQMRYECNQKLMGIISEKQKSLAVNEQFVNQLTQSETVIEQLTQMTAQLEQEQHALKILITMLSPQDGLIAESLVGFLNQFLNEMRNVLDNIWSYPMYPYMELTEEGVELDYRFKVDIDDGNITVKDVAYLSRGQKEIMNFAFKLILMQHLGLQDYPLFMDEIGGSFDAYHRDKLYRYVKQLVESNQVQQVFIISHIASSHDALTQADFVTLDPDALMRDDKLSEIIKLSSSKEMDS